MKKYLMTGIAALTLCAGFTSCSHNDDIEPITQAQIDKAKYDQAFLAYVGGKIASNQDWGFSATPAASRITRSITIKGDTYDAFTFPTTEELTAAFPTAIPEDAKTDEELEALYKGKNAVNENGEEIIADWGGPITMWDLYAIYFNMVGKVINNIKVTTPGEYSVGHNWANPADRVYNVYISVDGDLTLKRNGAEHVNFYILKGNVTIDKDFGECGGIISVAAGATVNDQRNHIAHNDGVRVYNRGTYNATNTTPTTNNNGDTYCYAIGNNVKFYNEKKLDVKGALCYNSGAGNTAYFYNVGEDVELTAPSMTLNSTCNFFSDGNVKIDGETYVTKDGIVWVNNGHYTSGSIIWSAKNSTFYNYCQLLVKGNAHMYDGEFNLMDNSYTEAATAEMDNFIVNMGSNTGINIKGAVDIKAQGDGTYQGFRTNGSNTYILIGGKVTVASHKNTLSISSGITYSIKQIEIIKAGKVITEAELQSNNDGDYPVLDLNGTNCPFGKLTVTPNTNDCGATWTVEEDEIVYDLRIWAEDLSAAEAGDFDFNDIVLDVKYDASNAIICLRAAGGTLPLYIIAGNKQWEVHEQFNLANPSKNITTKTMINTAPGKHTEYTPVVIETGVRVLNPAEANTVLKLKVEKNGELQEMLAPKGEPSCKLAVDKDLDWLDERTSIKGEYELFVPWANENYPNLSKWWEQ